MGPARAPSRLFVLRHGAVDPAWHGRIYGALDIPLSPGGQDEARRAARRLESVPLAAVVSSHLSRARFGARCLLENREVPPLIDAELRELERGDWAGLHLAELEAASPGAWQAWCTAPHRIRPPGGESLGDLATRVLPRFAHWASAFPGRSIALVVHGWVLRVLTCHALGLGVDRAPSLDVRTGDIAVLDWSGDAATRPELVAWAVDQLPPAGPGARDPD